jgi:N6-adenosine-specific RNA methylase IME4
MSLAHQIMPTGEHPVPSLIRYDAACRALAEAKSVDDVKDIRDRSEAMRAYAKQAKNKQLEVDAAEIRIRAERRLGEMIAGQRVTVGLSEGGRPKKTPSVEEVVFSRPVLAEAGIDHKLSARAQKMAAVPEAEFESMVGEWRDRVEAEHERVTTNLLKAGEKRLARDEKEAALAAKMRAAAASLGQGSFGVVYADPPWRFEPYSRDTGMDRAADNHYPTMLLDDIAALEVPAADDCVLFLWATAPMLPEALRVMAAWGFTYKSHIIWAKDRIGTGYWTRNKHELLLIGTKGSIPAPEMGTQPESLILAAVGAHSAKPELFAELIERQFPNLPKIEMFARTARPGWHGWGAEAGQPVSADDAGRFDSGSLTEIVVNTQVQVLPGMPIQGAKGGPTGMGRSDSVERHAPNSQSDGDAFAAVKGKARLANVNDVEPSLSGTDPQKPNSSPAADKAEAPSSSPEASATQFTNTRCQKPDSCKWAHSQASCASCSAAWMKARAAA